MSSNTEFATDDSNDDLVAELIERFRDREFHLTERFPPDTSLREIGALTGRATHTEWKALTQDQQEEVTLACIGLMTTPEKRLQLDGFNAFKQIASRSDGPNSGLKGAGIRFDEVHPETGGTPRAGTEKRLAALIDVLTTMPIPTSRQRLFEAAVDADVYPDSRPGRQAMYRDVTRLLEDGSIEDYRLVHEDILMRDDRWTALKKIVDLQTADGGPTNARSVYYRATSEGLGDKNDSYYNAVQRDILLMRRAGIVSYSKISDLSRTRYRVDAYATLQAALDQMAYGYRTDPWVDSGHRPEIWVESRSAASLILDEAHALRIPVFICSGQVSDSYAWQAAQEWKEDSRIPLVLAAFDGDPHGQMCRSQLQSKLAEFSGRDAVWVDMAITEEDRENLPGSEPKRIDWVDADGVYHTWQGESVEIEALEPIEFRQRLRDYAMEYLPGGESELDDVNAEDEAIKSNLWALALLIEEHGIADIIDVLREHYDG